MLERILIALRLKKAAPKRAAMAQAYRGHIPPRPMPSPAPWRRSFEPARSEPAPLPALVDSIAPPPGADSWEQPTEPATFSSGRGGEHSGAGATGHWDAPAPSASSSDSGGSDSSSSASAD